MCKESSGLRREEELCDSNSDGLVVNHVSTVSSDSPGKAQAGVSSSQDPDVGGWTSTNCLVSSSASLSLTSPDCRTSSVTTSTPASSTTAPVSVEVSPPIVSCATSGAGASAGSEDKRTHRADTVESSLSSVVSSNAQEESVPESGISSAQSAPINGEASTNGEDPGSHGEAGSHGDASTDAGSHGDAGMNGDDTGSHGDDAGAEGGNASSEAQAAPAKRKVSNPI